MLASILSRLVSHPRLLLWGCAASFALRLLLVWWLNPDFHSAEDFHIARNIAAGNGFSFVAETGPSAYKAPVYPYILAGFITMSGGWAKLLIALVQHTVGAFTPLLLRRLGRAAGLGNAAEFAAWGYLLHPSYLYYPSVLEPTTLTVALAAVWGERGLVARAIPAAINVVVLGLLSGALMLLQPVGIPIVIGGIAGFYLANRSRTLRPLRHAVVSAAVAICVILPWTARNYVAFDRFIAIKSPFWLNIYEGFLPADHGLAAFDLIPAAEQRYIDSLREIRNDVLLEAEYRRVASDVIIRHPELYIAKAGWQAVLYWTFPPRYFSGFSTEFVVVRAAPAAILLMITTFGFHGMWRKNRNFAAAIAGILLYLTAVYAATQAANIRYKLDAEWLQLYFAGVCAAEYAEKKRNRRL